MTSVIVICLSVYFIFAVILCCSLRKRVIAIFELLVSFDFNQLRQTNKKKGYAYRM